MPHTSTGANNSAAGQTAEHAAGHTDYSAFIGTRAVSERQRVDVDDLILERLARGVDEDRGKLDPLSSLGDRIVGA